MSNEIKITRAAVLRIEAKSENAARRALAEALRDRARFDGGSDIRPETRVDALAAAWFRSLEGKDRSITTLTQYRYRLDHQVIPGLGALRVRELTTSTIDRHLTAVAHKHGAATARMVRSVVSGMCSLAVRHDAIERNPVREASPISTKPKNPPRALTEAQALQLRAMLTYDTKAIARDLPAFVCGHLNWPRLGRSSSRISAPPGW